MLEQLGAEVRAVSGDIADPATARALADAAAELGGRSVLVNNAGMSMRGNFRDIAPEVFSTVVETNVVGSALVTQAFLDQIIRTNGSVVFISSVTGMTGFPGISVYAAAKMALTGLAESLRGELLGSGVHVSVVYLGFTENDEDKQILSADGSNLRLKRRYDMTQREVASAIERAVRRRKEKVVLTWKGTVLRVLQRVSPKLVSAIVRRSGGRFHQMRH